ncbi:MAG TPA: hypothetical protein VJS44_06120 [Pyrinomonadaceae bacterium]|nr:hypothetical protein [Pyrinomonadaceae bacterium]
MSSTNNGNTNGNGSIPAGDIRFYDNYLPPLDAGDYTISVQQVVNSTALAPGGKAITNQNFPTSAPLKQAFTVVAPRFALDPADIQSVFPPSAGIGTYDQNLPHVVLTKRNLPWERFLVPEDRTTPWMAVLLFSPDEIIAPETGNTSSTLANPSRAGTYNLPDVLNPPQGTLGPAVTEEYEDMLNQVTSITVTSSGTGYTSAPDVTISGGGGTGAVATAQVKNGAVSITLTGGGTGYTSDPTVTISGGGGTGATAVARRGVVCMAIDIPTDVFTKVTPRFEPKATTPVDELKYLAHCRQVNTGDKETSAAQDNGWFSVVIGNRFPSPGAGPVMKLVLDEGGLNYTSAPDVVITGGGGTGATAVAQVENGEVTSITLTQGGSGYTSAPSVVFSGGGGGTNASATAQIGAPWVAHLVSLEGYASYLVDNPSWPTGTERVRLVSLYSWNFTCLSETGDFRDLMLNLIAGEPQGGAGLLLHLPVTSEQQTSGSTQATVQQALTQGYTGLAYDTMIGDDTFAWYRGPLVPAPRALFRNADTYTSAASAMIYDQTNALFDESYAAAWQTGRLLALSDQSFGTKLLQVRLGANRTVNLLAGRLGSKNVQALGSVPDLSESSADAVTQLRTLLQRDFVSSSFMGYLLNGFSDGVAIRIAQSAPLPGQPEAEALDTVPASQQAANKIETLRKLYQIPAVQQLLLDSAGDGQQPNSSDSPAVYVANWLAELRLLYGVPFVNLVPDARMLPKESLRFFFVDPNYIEALVGGALSICIQSSRDLLAQSLIYPKLQASSKQAAMLVRSRRTGKASQAMSQQADATVAQAQGIAGFLLRSAVVSGWPGLEVRAYSDAAGTTPLSLIRMDRLAPDLLICLFPDTTARVEISEPKESLAFGHEDDFGVDVRWVTDAPPNQPIGSIIPNQQPLDISKYFRSQEPGPVLDVKTWQPYLQSQLNAAYGAGSSITLGPADFAIEMVRAPEELVLVHSS